MRDYIYKVIIATIAIIIVLVVIIIIIIIMLATILTNTPSGLLPFLSEEQAEAMYPQATSQSGRRPPQ